MRFIKLKALTSVRTGLPALHCGPGSHFFSGLMELPWTSLTIDHCGPRFQTGAAHGFPQSISPVPQIIHFLPAADLPGGVKHPCSITAATPVQGTHSDTGEQEMMDGRRGGGNIRHRSKSITRAHYIKSDNKEIK